MARFLLIVFVATVGFLIGWYVPESSDRSSAPEIGARPAEPIELGPSAPTPSAPSIDLAPSDRAAGVEPSERVARADEPLIGPRLERFARDELARGWSSVRQDPMPDALLAIGRERWERVVLDSPSRIGAELATERTDREHLASDDPFEVLAALENGDYGPQIELVADAERFSRFFACAAGGALDGPSNLRAPQKVAADGATFVFPAGVFDLEQFMQGQRYPSCMGLAGAGMNTTLFLVRGFGSRDRLDRLEIRDCTLFAEGCDAIDQRGKAAVLAFERVRVVGFDCGAGGSNAISTAASALQARDCEFLGGYGRHPDRGTLFDVRTRAQLARFDRCLFARMSLTLGRARAGATIVFADCRMEDLTDSPSDLADPQPGVLFERCSIDRLEEGETPPKVELDALFPGWKTRVAR